MSEFGLFIGWGATRTGREAIASTVFDEAVEYWTRLKGSGDIEGFEIVMLGAHGGDLTGFALLKGERERLARVHASPAFMRFVLRAEACLDSVGVVPAYVDDAVMVLMTAWREATADIV